MLNWTFFTIGVLWVGFGAWAILYSSKSKITRLLGIITIVLGTKILDWIL